MNNCRNMLNVHHWWTWWMQIGEHDECTSRIFVVVLKDFFFSLPSAEVEDSWRYIIKQNSHRQQFFIEPPPEMLSGYCILGLTKKQHLLSGCILH